MCFPEVDERTRNRIDTLLAQMTPGEKAGQLTQYFYFGTVHDSPDQSHVTAVEEAIRAGKAGAVLFITDPAVTNRLQKLAIEETRLGIPLLVSFDVNHGFRTIFPVPIAMAASWDPDMIATSQSVAAREARAIGIHWTFNPMVDISRDPRWGRMIEGAGEDPYLASAVGVAHVQGFQGADPTSRENVIAGPKHFAGYGAPLGGRDYDEVNLSDSELWNVYLRPFEATVKAGAGNIMSAYMPLNGIPATGNHWLFSEVLRETWGFKGFTVSDADAVRNLVTHHFAKDNMDAGARALTAGVDMEMTISDPAFDSLPDALESGAIDEATLDAAVRRILEAKFALGLFDQPFVDEGNAARVLADPSHREESRIAAERSAVLLRNENATIPLDADALTSIAVLGPLGNAKRDTLGPWSFDFDLDETVTVFEGIRNHVGASVEVSWAPGVRNAQRQFSSMFDMFPGNAPDRQEDFDDEAEFTRAVDLAKSSDIAIVVLGEWQNMIGENASRSTLDLPGEQLRLLQAVVKTGTQVVLVLMNGRPLDLRWAVEHVPAILDIWYPGTLGGTATANLLFGDVAPGGKLPFTWPRSVGQVPMISTHTVSHQPEKQDQRYWDEPGTPLFPFGYGLGYTTFDYSDLSLDKEKIAPDGSLTISARVTNTGERDGDEVAQLYIHQRYGGAARPVRELKGFRRIHLAAGESRIVEFTLGPDELKYWNAASRSWIVESAEFDVWVGGDSTASLGANFRVTG